ncbi:MAG TPA: hypothetical protein VM509_03155, partial [Planctomycetota bacterium]|nr:hypothetical protein [Planctomycetota bacterium]
MSWSSFTPPALVGCAVVVVSAFAGAQESQGEFQKVEMRVVDGRPGAATLDRGGVDGLRRGDRVALRQKDGSVVHGTLIRIEERASIAELDDPSLVPASG